MKESHAKKHDVLIERLCEIFSVLYQGNTIDKAWLCTKFGITARTAYRDLARLAHLLDQVSPGRYRLSTHLLPTLHTGHLAEFADFAGVAHLFPRRDGQSLRNSMKNRDNIAFHGASSRENYTMDALIDQLNQAIAARQEVTYRYREKNRCVQPYRLINHYGLWYLAAVDAGTLKAFELALICRFAPGTSRFTADPQVLEELEAGSGIRFGKKTEVQLRISAHAAKFVSRRPLFPAQRVVERHDDGGMTISCDIRDPHTLFRWLRYWLPDVSIHSPASLREAFKQDLQRRYAAASDDIVHPIPAQAR